VEDHEFRPFGTASRASSINRQINIAPMRETVIGRWEDRDRLAYENPMI